MNALLPQSLAKQTMLMLAVGMALVIVVGVSVAALAFMGTSRADHTEDFVGRVVTFVAIAQEAPGEARSAIVAATSRSGLTISPPAKTELSADMRTEAYERRLARELAPLGADLLAVGHPMSESAGGAGNFWSPHGPVVARVALADGTRLDIANKGGRTPLHAIGPIVPALGVVGIGLTALAVWLGRRVTRPLGVFATAATRLGTDVAAAPLPERGPSELRAAARAFNQMQSRIRRLIEDRVLMLAAVAHDLRTPITRMRLRAEFVDDPTQQAKMLTDLDEMQAMIDATLAFAREETIIEDRAVINLRELLDEIAAQMPEAHICGAANAEVEARRGALKRAFRNLIENAVKYGHRAAAHLTATPSELIVAIEDDGPGIPEAELESVFRPFYRLEPSRSRDTGGTGLGLSVARSVFRSHGGEVTLANRPGGGLVQTVKLPRQETSQGASS